MKNLNVFFILIFLFFSQIGTSQINPELISLIKGKYYYQGKVYHRNKELKEIYKTNPEAYKAYNAQDSRISIHRALTAISVGSIIGLARWENKRTVCISDCDGPDLTGVIMSYIVYSGSLIFIIGSAIPRYKHSGKAREIFNEGVLSSSKVGTIPPNINFQTTQNGIGLVLNF